MTGLHGSGPPSAWIVRFAGLVPEGGAVLDLAAGHGRHARHFRDRGHPVTALDRDASLLVEIAGVEAVAADLEDGPWPLPGRRFAGIVVTNYLHRPLFPDLIAALASGGALLYETFADGNERFGKPANPAHLLRRGELLDLALGRLRIVAYEDLEVSEPRPAMVQRLAAVNDLRAYSAAEAGRAATPATL
jgi:SAM-dependent methyltransferase